MSVDIAVVGTPFLDLVFDGLPEEVTPGREVMADALHVAPGGTAMQAIAASRTGASVALVAPRSDDDLGIALAGLIEAEGIRWVGPRADRTSVTAVLLAAGGAAMVSASGDEEVAAVDIARLEPRAVVLSLGRLGLAPGGASIYAVTGQVEIDAGASLDTAAGAEAVIVNHAEATALTGLTDPAEAARRLTRLASVGVVTVGAGGAVAAAAQHREVIRARPPSATTGDATGAGDVLVGSLAASSVLGATVPIALERAVADAARAAAGPTAYAGLGPHPVSPP